ncbi:E3 ubiquitin-protein ligase listerin-like [Gigantopelta aegis]|uniref:E3 ubiquitin-protein ligase listerin-like n=1 Tax=Gigantopelta aegis TaxID=1735272 RepID=UPI001B88BAED|nr:E3 ubiquitin-protein ligase listerin-like [Gigantopelta aegis]
MRFISIKILFYIILQPSSSSQAAELLSAAGTAPIGFLGFGSPAFVPASQSFDDTDNSLDSDFRMVLRKLSKRDSITKIKALQEFIGLCQEKDEDCLKAVLPFWPRIYNKMAIDIDYRVRETAQQAMNTLVSKVRRNLAPYVKSIMGSWLLSQCDTYPTVSSAAKQAFQSAFPPARQQPAINYCKLEIAEYLIDNLLNQAPGTLSDPKNNSKEDMEQKYNRVMASSLLALCQLLTSLQADELGSIKGHLRGLLNDGKLWKFSKSSISNIKSGMFSFCASLCQTCPDVAKEYVTKIAPFVLNSLDITDPVIISSLWEAILSVVNYIEDCWSHVSWPKSFWPKLRNVLETGCFGNASIIGPSILPLLSKISSACYGEPEKFYSEFFVCFRNGLSKDSLLQSPSECSSMIKAFVECCQFICKQITASGGQEILLRIIVLDHFLPVVESSLIETRPALSKSPLYSVMGTFLQSLEKSESSVYVVDLFWKELLQCVEENFSDTRENSVASPLLERLPLLFQGLKNMQTTKAKAEKVRFVAEVKFSSEVTKDDNDSNVSCATNVSELSTFSRAFLQDVTSETFQKAYKLKHVSFVKLFSELVGISFDEATVVKLLEVCDISTSGDVFLTFVKILIVPWLQEDQLKSNSSCVSHLLSIVFICITHVKDSESTAVLADLCHILTSPLHLCYLIEKALVKRQYLPCVQHWFKSSSLTGRVVSLTQKICQLSVEDDFSDNKEMVDHGWAVVSLVLSTSDNEEPVFSTECIQGIIDTIHLTLTKLGRSQQENRVDQAVLFVTKAAFIFFNNLKMCLSISSAEDLILALFSVCIDMKDFISDDTLQEAKRAWVTGLQVVVKQTGALLRDKGFIMQACSLSKTLIESRAKTLKSYKHILSNIETLVTTLQKTLPSSTWTDPTVQAVLQNLIITPQKLSSYKNVLDYIYVTGRLVGVDVLTEEPSKEQPGLRQTIFTSLFNSGLLKYAKTGQTMAMSLSEKGETKPEITPDGDVDLNEEADSPGNEDSCDWSSDDCDIFLNSLSGLVISRLWREMDACIDGDIHDGIALLEESIAYLINTSGHKDKANVVKNATARSEQCGRLDAITLQTLLDELEKNKAELELVDSSLLDRCSTLTTSTVHTLQAVVKHFSGNGKQDMAQIMVARIISVAAESASNLDGGLGPLSVLVTTLTFTPDVEGSEFKDMMKAVLNQLMTWRQEDDELMLFASDLSEAAVPKLSLNTEVMRFVKLILSQVPRNLSSSEWDFIMCSTVAWIQSINGSKKHLLSSLPVMSFAVSACDLLATVVSCLHSEVLENPSAFPEDLLTEWQEFFSGGAYSALLPLYVKLAGAYKHSAAAGLESVWLCSVGLAVSHCPKQQILGHQLSPYFIAGESSPLPDTLQTLINHFGPMLLFADKSVQVTSFWILNSIMSELPQYEQEYKDDFEPETKEEVSRCPPSCIMKVIEDGDAALDIVLADVGVQDCVLLEPKTDEFQYTLGYLLAWRLLLRFFKSSSPELRAQYAVYFKKIQLVPRLLDHLFRLISDKPQSVYFESTEDLVASDQPSSNDIQRLVCMVYRQSLETLPALVRQWWIDQDRKTSLYIDKFTKTHVSPLLSSSEISSVQVTDSNLDGITIKGRPSTREVVARYVMAEVTIEVVISLPENYPLGNISVISNKRVGVSQAQWDKWLLHLNIFLQHQNGTILEGVKLWKNNIDKRFEGVDDCMICYSVLHGTNFQLPKLMCKTCKKKFHSTCLILDLDYNVLDPRQILLNRLLDPRLNLF